VPSFSREEKRGLGESTSQPALRRSVKKPSARSRLKKS
jgi:hypothetical protein